MSDDLKKQMLRTQFRTIRNSVSQSYKTYAMIQATNIYMQHIHHTLGSNIASYIPFNFEFNVSMITNTLRNIGHNIVIPYDASLPPKLALLTDVTHPIHCTLEAIIVPLVAFDSQLNRLGNGKGWYDRLLYDQQSALRIGIAYEAQRYQSILPHEQHDQPLDCVITEKQIYINEMPRNFHNIIN